METIKYAVIRSWPGISKRREERFKVVSDKIYITNYILYQ